MRAFKTLHDRNAGMGFPILLVVAMVASGALPARTPPDASSEGSVTVAGQVVTYRAVAGTLVVHPKGWDDNAAGPEPVSTTEASIFYVAYFKNSASASERPITFVYNGGPGESTALLHIVAFGPKRVVIKNAAHTAAPYKVIDNAYSLLDATDVVFIDAPGTGFSRVMGPDKEKGFYGIDADAHAFGEFIAAFMSRHGRWMSPKYLLGESYGTPRNAVLANVLATEFNVDVNGIIMISQILNFDLGMGASAFNPGTDQPYVVALPAYAAAAWYHNRLAGSRPTHLRQFLSQVEQFATNEYASALQAGASLEPERRVAIAQRMSDFTGLPAAYILQSDLRLDARQFRKMLLNTDGTTIGGADARFIGRHMDPVSKGAEYDPVMSSIGAAVVAALNDHVRQTLRYESNRAYKVSADLLPLWIWDRPQPSNAPTRIFGIANVMPDLAAAMKRNRNLKVMVNGGYYDLGTSYFASQYEMRHLPIPPELQDNIEFHYYESGHMPYIHEPALKELHDNIAGFIRRTDNVR